MSDVPDWASEAQGIAHGRVFGGVDDDTVDDAGERRGRRERQARLFVVRVESTGKKLVVAEGLRETVAAKLESELTTLATFKGQDFENVQYQHPFYERKSPIIIGGEYITTDAGTGLVHTAPGHGQDDYISGMNYGLPLYSPVDNAGLFTEDAGGDLEGKSVLGEGNELCIEKLSSAGALLKQEAYGHKYRMTGAKKPTIFRATEQWFASVEGFREKAMSELDKLQFIPESGAKRMRPMVSGRSDWCISVNGVGRSDSGVLSQGHERGVDGRGHHHSLHRNRSKARLRRVVGDGSRRASARRAQGQGG